MTALPGMTAEEYAAGLIRRALDSAVTPDLQYIADESALTVREVDAIRDRILSGRRGTQTLGRPRAAAPIPPVEPAAPLAGPAEPDRDQLVASAIGHESAKVRRAAKKAHDTSVRLGLALDELTAALAEHEEAAAERARRAKRIAKLEAELAELRGRKAPSARAEASLPCHLCERRFAKHGWLRQHIRNAHGEAS